MTGLVVLFAIVVILGAVAIIAQRAPSDSPPASYTCRSGARVEGDLDLDDGRPTDPGEELTVVSDPEWVEDTLVSASEKLGGKR